MTAITNGEGAAAGPVGDRPGPGSRAMYFMPQSGAGILAFAKLRALADGTAIVRRELTGT
jgi:hypothetical protein